VKSFFSSLIVLFIVIPNGYSLNVDEATIHALINETKALRQETKDLRDEVTQLKRQLAVKSTPRKTIKPRVVPQPKPKTHSASKADISPAPSNTDVQRLTDASRFSILIDPDLGIPGAYNGSALLTNLAQANGDLLALQYRQTIENVLSKTQQYYLVLSGSVGGQAYVIKPYVDSRISDIDLTIANITAMAGIGRWVTGFLSIDYDNLSPGSLNPPQIGPRYANSRIYLDQGYVTIGNLNQAPLYGSIGQMYLPFGQYNGFMINSPLTASLFTTVERPVLLGYSHSTDITELDIEVYGYQGETASPFASSNVNEWGASADYFINKSNWNSNIGIGYISNIADAEGIQLNGQFTRACSLFGGFAYPCNAAETLVHKVPGFDIHGNLTVGPFSFITEYITGVRAFSPIDLSFNRKGAKPRAFDIEGGYEFRFLRKPSNIAFGYGFTQQALGLLLPAKSYSITLTTSLWRNTTQSLGYQHDINYGFYTEAGGQQLPVYRTIDRDNLGRSSDSIIFALTASF